jgi:serine O-acetyltransferase
VEPRTTVSEETVVFCHLAISKERESDMFERLKRDIQVVFERDPAARSVLEVLFCYPGLHVLWIHRLAHRLYNRGWILLPRMLSNFARLLTGIEIHPGAKLGEGLFIDHGMGVVIGETAEVGTNVTIYQGVTLGGTGKEKGKRHPTVGNNVVIATGAKVLGSFKVGDNSKIGAGSVVLSAVPPNSTVVGIPGKVVVRNNCKVVPDQTDGDDLKHDNLPDPEGEMLICMQRHLNRLEERVIQLEQELKKHDLKSLQ